MTEIFRNYVDGRWREANRRRTGELVGTYTRSGPEDVAAAVAAAKTAFGRWRLYPAPKRGEFLFRVAQSLVQRKEEFAREMTEEMGKVSRRRAATSRRRST